MKRNMNTKEINEYLAEHLFGKVRGKDFGEIICDHTVAPKYCVNCPKASQYNSFRQCLTEQESSRTNYFYVTDYITNYQPVLDKLLHNGQDSVIILDTQFGHNVTYVDPYREFSVKSFDTLGEAICRAAVEYLSGEYDECDECPHGLRSEN